MKFSIAIAALFGAASPVFGEAVTPVEKVITLLEDLKTGVEAEGAAEAGTHDSFACFCKDTTKTKADTITGGRDNIDLLSATIAEKTSGKEEKESELAKRKQDHEAMSAELKSTEVQYAKEKAEYEASAADLSKAISSLDSAIKAMEASKPAALLALSSSVKSSLALADVLGLIAATKRGAVSAFLQTGVDPADPTYKYHSQGIVETLAKLNEDFKAEKKDLDEQWAVSEKTFKDTISALGTKMDENTQAMEALDGDIETLKSDIAKSREDLVNAEAVLKDDQAYLKDLTEQCEARAKDWDQRSQLRSDELTALAGALEILKNKVAGLDTAVNKRALLQEKNASLPAKVEEKKANLVSVSRHVQALAFIQEVIATQNDVGRSQLRGAHTAALSAQARQDKVVALLGKESRRLQSAALASLAMHLLDDPFVKVKTLIQQLIERLLRESTSEATKKGFCDTEVGKANQDRDFRLADSKKLDQEIQALEIKLKELNEEIDLLTTESTDLRNTLATATENRAQEKKDNLDTIKQAKEGVEAVTEALNILKVFYKQAKKATVFVQASPVDEDTSGAGFAGAYKGKQEQSGGIIGMLEVIKSDFGRTASTTEASEKAAHEEFVEFDRISKTDISGKEMKMELDKEDVQTTENKLVEGKQDLQTAQDLLDGALKRLEDLAPTCIDTTMSFEERVAKREEEMEALKKALCILDTDGVEADCQGQGQGDGLP